MEIPQYPASRPLVMTDKPLLDQLFTNIKPRMSELSFAGLFLFRKAHEYKISTVAGSIIVLGKRYDGTDYFLPPLGGDTFSALQILFASQLPLYGADEQIANSYFASNPLDIYEMRDSFDYLYFREDLATLPGSRFHKKKNRINYFTSRHNYIVTHFSEEYCDGCLALLDRWYNSSGSEPYGSVFTEVEAASEAIRSAEALGLEGVVIIVDENVVAFSLGERLNHETAVCHFEKADPFSEGLYQLVNREFARMLFAECRYLNREQDLGDTGLRQAKISYHPVELIKKYLITSKHSKDFVALYGNS